MSRRLYGEYLEHLLCEAESGSAPGALERVVGEVLDVESAAGGSATLTFADGSRREVDRVALALGNYSPSDPPAEGAEFYASERYVRDPWIRGSLDVVLPAESVLMLGTGLTALDIALDLASRGVKLPLRAISRHGLLPQPHASGAASSVQTLPDLGAPPRTIRGLLSAVRQAARSSGDWRGVVGSLRGITPDLWKELDPVERSRFLRHVRPYWDVHRHRVAPATAEATRRMMDLSELQIRAGRVLRYEPSEGGVRVLVRPRGRSQVEALFVERVVNCTGPSTDVRRIGDRLLDTLRARGLAVPDPLRLGLEVSDDLALLDADGRPSPFLILVGPLLKARFWEATAVPELRQHAANAARRLLP